MDAIILAGGLGTRLRDTLKDIPKPLAPVCGKPFLNYILDFLYANGISNVVISVGYLSEKITSAIGNTYRGMVIKYSSEQSPLGTGGAIKKAASLCRDDYFLVINGDTFFDVCIDDMLELHKKDKNDITVAAKRMPDAERYGSIITSKNKLIGLREKGISAPGLINGGIYIINKAVFDGITEEIFSFENSVLNAENINIGVFESDGHFIDIGIPEDYRKSQNEQKLLLCKRTRRAVFLDRDGTINLDTVHTHKISDLIFLNGAEKAILNFKRKGYLVIVITNQAGIGKNYYGIEDVISFHGHMNNILMNRCGEIIDAFYFCPHHPKAVLDEFRSECDCRKPKPGMIFNAVRDFKKIGIDIDLDKSVLAGDKLTDISAAKNAGIGTSVLIGHNDINNGVPDMHLENLFELSEILP